MMSASTIDEFKALVLNYPGLTFEIFGNGTQDDLNITHTLIHSTLYTTTIPRSGSINLNFN